MRKLDIPKHLQEHWEKKLKKEGMPENLPKEEFVEDSEENSGRGVEIDEKLLFALQEHWAGRPEGGSEPHRMAGERIARELDLDPPYVDELTIKAVEREISLVEDSAFKIADGLIRKNSEIIFRQKNFFNILLREMTERYPDISLKALRSICERIVDEKVAHKG